MDQTIIRQIIPTTVFTITSHPIPSDINPSQQTLSINQKCIKINRIQHRATYTNILYHQSSITTKGQSQSLTINLSSLQSIKYQSSITINNLGQSSFIYYHPLYIYHHQSPIIIEFQSFLSLYLHQSPPDNNPHLSSITIKNQSQSIMNYFSSPVTIYHQQL